MGRTAAASNREEMRMKQAVAALVEPRSPKKMTLRRAGTVFRVPKSTLWDRVSHARRRRNRRINKVGRRRAVSETEEETVVEVQLRHADEGRPLNRRYLQDALAMLVEAMPLARKDLLRSKNWVPGPKFLRALEKHHKNVLVYGRGSRQEAKRLAAVNAETVTSNFAKIEMLMKRHNIDGRRLKNLNEIDGTPGKDVSGAVKERR